MINIILVYVVICSVWITPCSAQQSNEKDKALLDRVVRTYNVIPRDLKTDEVLRKINEADEQVKLMMDSLTTKEVKEKAQLLRFNGLLWSLGGYVLQTGDQALKSELAEQINGLDLDSPVLDLLNDVETANLLNGYFQVFMPNMSELERATYVLYNIKSEKVRNPYVLSSLVSELKQRGYSENVQNLLDDIELCSKTASTIQKAKELKEMYYPVRAGEMASDFEKPDKVHTLFPDEIPIKMWPLPVRDLLFLGKASEKKLTEAGIHTIGDMAHSSEAEIQRLLGNKAGHQLYQYACGIDDSAVRAQPEEAKGFSVETTFNDDIISVEQVLPILLEQCDIVATRMRRKEKKCTSISVNFRTLDFRNKSHQMTLPNATDTTDEIYKNAQKLFAESWKGEPLRLIGVALTNLTDESFEQLSLFEDNEKKERRRKLDATMDEIRKKFGNDKITRASIMNSSTGIAKKARAQMKNEDDKESRTVE